ncbi:MAG: TrmB family transcriptional regulator [Halobacteriota archaeon]
MTDRDDFITDLVGFGLTQKEAKCYFYLLKYGPKTPSPLAKSLHTYREDVHRTLTVLIDKGMVRPSLDSPTLYTAVELEKALESALKQHEAELREMKTRKRELEELSRQQHFRGSDEVTTFKIIKSLKELLEIVLPLLSSVEEEWLSIIPSSAVIIASQFGFSPFIEEFIERRGTARAIINITYPIAELTGELVDVGVDIRHADQLGILFTVFDRKSSTCAIHAEIARFSLDEPMAALYIEDPVYANYLLSDFEILWEQSTDAEERIRKLLKQGSSEG